MIFSVTDCNGRELSIVILHIPKRSEHITPLHFTKDGPGTPEKNKSIFLKDDIFFRRGDESVEAKGPRIFELSGERLNPHLANGGDALTSMLRVNRISHNLPDRNFICAKFIGREHDVDLLWRWLGDDLSHVKVLAGEGGLGKSSIAFEFAELVSETRNAPFEQIIWLTAKEKQFNAMEDRYNVVAERHYDSYEGLLRALCERLPFTADELEEASQNDLKRMLKRGLSQISSLIIIDDIDSLPTEEQRQVLELGMFIGSANSRLLLTTRFNQSFSLDNVIKVSGLKLDGEFPEYLDSLRERLGLQQHSFKQAEIERIHATSDGSPLFTESILRLLRFDTLNDAITLWKNEKGANCRAAALKREVELLSAEGQRILYALALLIESSKVELCEVLGYTAEVVEKELSALHALFLVSAPSIAAIARFRVPENTRKLVLDPSTRLVTDPIRIQKDVEEFKRKSDRTPAKDARVAAAISQAESLFRLGEISAAEDTIMDARRRTNDHKDLLCYAANLNMKKNPQNIDNARQLARKAYTKGCKKIELFQCWFEAEWSAEHYIGALEAADAALENKIPSNYEWLIRKSAALASKATDQSKTGAVTAAITTMFEASSVLRSAIGKKRQNDSIDWDARQAALHDQIWFWAGYEDKGLGRASQQIKALEFMWNSGDVRITNFRRILAALEGAVLFFEQRESRLSTAQRNFFEQLLNKGHALIDLRKERFPLDNRHDSIAENFEKIRFRAYETILNI
jgi:hypothetical protein